MLQCDCCGIQRLGLNPIAIAPRYFQIAFPNDTYLIYQDSYRDSSFASGLKTASSPSWMCIKNSVFSGWLFSEDWSSQIYSSI